MERWTIRFYKMKVRSRKVYYSKWRLHAKYAYGLSTKYVSMNTDGKLTKLSKNEKQAVTNTVWIMQGRVYLKHNIIFFARVQNRWLSQHTYEEAVALCWRAMITAKALWQIDYDELYSAIFFLVMNN